MKAVLITLALTFTAVSAPPALAADTIYTSWKNNLAAGGYDTVSFFSGKPQIGKKEYAFDYAGAKWRFATRGNLDLFKTNPEAFMPQYGGYCAYAASKGAIATSVPDAWTIYEGKLYLNFSQDVRDIWRRDIPGNILRADGYWPDILTG